MEESDYQNIQDAADIEAYANSATEDEWVKHILRGYYLLAKGNPLVFTSDKNRRDIARRYSEQLLPFCNLHMMLEQVAIADAQKQLAESQTQLAEQQRDISKEIKKSADDTTKLTIEVRDLTKTIKTLTWAMLILTGVAVVAAITANLK